MKIYERMASRKKLWKWMPTIIAPFFRREGNRWQSLSAHTIKLFKRGGARFSLSPSTPPASHPPVHSLPPWLPQELDYAGFSVHMVKDFDVHGDAELPKLKFYLTLGITKGNLCIKGTQRRR